MKEEACPNCGLRQDCTECLEKLPFKLEGERGRLIEELLNKCMPLTPNSDAQGIEDHNRHQWRLVKRSGWLKLKMHELVDLHKRVVLNQK